MRIAFFIAFIVIGIVRWTLPVAAFQQPKQEMDRNSEQRLGRTKLKTQQRPVDAVIYNPSLIKDKEFDTIVIGSGIGGLATAAILAQSKENHKVLVLEQHYKCGGCTHTFEKKGYKFATGVHYVGEVGGEESKTGLRFKELLDAVTPKNDIVEWTPMQANYDTIVLGRDKATSRRYKIYAKENQQRLKEQFPNEHEAIEKYFSLCSKATASVTRSLAFKVLPKGLVKAIRWTGLMRFLDKGYHKYSKLTLSDVVHSVTDNPDLQTILMYNWGDYGSVPAETPFVMHALLVSHYHDGGNYPTGGPDMIPKKIIPTITAHGGQVLCNVPVRRIMTENKAAVGVELKDGTQIPAKNVVSDAGVINTCHYLVPPEQGEAMIKRLTVQEKNTHEGKEKSWSGIHTGATGLTLFVGLKGDHDTDLHLPRYQLFMFPSASMEDDLEKLESPETLEERLEQLTPEDLTPLFVGAPSGKDGDWSKHHPGKSSLEIITAAPWKWFEKFGPSNLVEEGDVDRGGRPGSRGTEYKEAKEKLAELMWARARQGLVDSGASENLPKTLAEVDTYELATPLTYAHFLHSEQGAFYGLSHDVNRFRPRIFFEELRPAVPEIPGLYLTGQDIAACGLTGAISGAYLCAAKILGVLDPFSLLQEVERNRVVWTPLGYQTSESQVDFATGEDEVSVGLSV